MKIREVLSDAQLALGALATGSSTAVAAGLIGGALAGYVTGGITVALAIVAYLIRNLPKKKSGAA